ncbi:MAG: helix-turn-helix domain-containing protein [Candidatus Limimorpha sp.]
MKIHIKNMVCPRCIIAVRTILVSCGLTPLSVRLGEVDIEEELDEGQKESVSEALMQMGFELLDNPRSQVVEQLRVSVIEWVRLNGERPNLSDYLCDRLHKDYSSLSKLFREVKGITLERFAIIHRVEYAKELLYYNQLSTSEIAYKLGYSSPSHFSAQFKQITGMTPKTMREHKPNSRVPLSDI